MNVGGERCSVNFAVNTLGYSRRLHVFTAPRQDAEHTYESLVRAFRYFDGSVKTVLVDNQKAAVLKNHNGNVVFNAGFLMLSAPGFRHTVTIAANFDITIPGHMSDVEVAGIEVGIGQRLKMLMLLSEAGFWRFPELTKIAYRLLKNSETLYSISHSMSAFYCHKKLVKA